MTARCAFCGGHLWAEPPDDAVRTKGPLVPVLVCSLCARSAVEPRRDEPCRWTECQRFPSGDDGLCSSHRAVVKKRSVQ